MTGDRRSRTARAVNIVLGTWLFISAFAWRHSPAQMNNTWILGVLVVLFAVIALWTSTARFVNTALAVWLFISAFALPADTIATVWNNALVALAVFISSLVPAHGEPMLRRRRPQPV
ncbi:MAG: hypothetical protein HYZ28_24545 [Myxococcales bacterium]|nr:hypothetical protein [Myxococcales bacterium]